MPPKTYKVTDPATGRTLKMTGDRPPTEAEIKSAFESKPAVPAPDTTGIEQSSGDASQIGGILNYVKGMAGSIPRAIINTGAWVDETMGTQTPESKAGYEKAKAAWAPTSPDEQLGGYAGDILTAVLPGNMVTNAGKAAAAVVPVARNAGPIVRGALGATRMLARGATEAAGGAAIAIPQGGDPTTGAVVGGTVGGLMGGGRAARGSMVNPNQVEREALEYVQSQGVPVDLGTMSGNVVAKGALYGADRTIPGSFVANKAAQTQAEALQDVSGQLAGRAHPTAVTAEQAGEGITGGLTQNIADSRVAQRQAYSDLEAIGQQHVRPVQVGVDAVTGAPIIEQMAMPADVTAAKAALRPIRDAVRRQMPVAQQAANPGLKALDNIIDGPDVVPVAILDADLGAIKTLARADNPNLRTVSQGLSARAVKELSDAVDAAIAVGGQPAKDALAAGRAATRTKYATAAVLKSIGKAGVKEPVRAFEKATARDDTAISFLREIQRETPGELPKIGRAVLDDMFDNAQTGGKFEGADGMARKWANLGAETKRMLYGPALTSELDKFFLASKRLAQNQNPSGTAGVTLANLSAGGFLWARDLVDVGTFVAGQTLGGVMSSLMRNPKAVRLLTQGMNAPKGSMTYRAVKRGLASIIKQTGMREATGDE